MPNILIEVYLIINVRYGPIPNSFYKSIKLYMFLEISLKVASL